MRGGSLGARVTVKLIPAGAVRVAVVNGMDPPLAVGETVVLQADGAPLLGRVVRSPDIVRDRLTVTEHTPSIARRATPQDQYLRQRHEHYRAGGTLFSCVNC
jgi:hypothetical protein